MKPMERETIAVIIAVFIVHLDCALCKFLLNSHSNCIIPIHFEDKNAEAWKG